MPPSCFLGWPNALLLQNDFATAALVPSIGRLVHFSARHGQNLLRLDAALQGHNPPLGDPFFNVGGHWLWPVAQSRWPTLSPNGRDWPPPPALADLPWSGKAWIDADGNQCGLLSRQFGAPLNVAVSRLFVLAPSSSALLVRQRVERTAPSDIPVTLWTISQVDQADRIAMPADAHSPFHGGIQTLIGARPSTLLAECGDVVVYRVAEGSETKLGSDSRRSWIAAAKGALVLFEAVSNDSPGEYPDGGCVVELFSNSSHGYSEIETLSPELNLPCGAAIENTLRMAIAGTNAPADPCGFADFVRSIAKER